jgi:hypothetical protein
MKTLFEFDLKKIAEVEKTEVQEDGSKLTKKVQEEVPVTFALKRPSRIESDSGEVFYNVEFGRNVRAGMLTNALVDKMYGSEGGVLAQVEIEEYANAYIKLGENLGKIHELEKEESKDTDALTELYEENSGLRQTISAYENARNSIYDNTAESVARHKTLFWWWLTLIYEKKGEQYSPVFPGETFEKKGESYDKIVELSETDKLNSKFYTELLAKTGQLVSLWFMSRANTVEDFAKVAGDYLASEEKEETEVDAETPAPEVAE